MARFWIPLLLLALPFAEAARADARGTIGFAQVLDVFEEHCVACHRGGGARAGLDLTSHEAVLAGSSSGEVLIAGDPEDSYLYTVTAHIDEPVMPPGGEMIPEDQLAILRTWIEVGLPKDQVTLPADSMASASAEEAEPVVEASESAAASTAAYAAGPVAAVDSSAAAGLVAASGQAAIDLFDAQSGEPVGKLEVPEGETRTLRFSADGRWLIAGVGVPSESGRVIVWDLATGTRSFETGVGYDWVLAADRSPDGRWIATGGPDRVVRLIDTADGAVKHELEKHSDWVLDAAFGPHGLVFATAGRDGAVFLWETESGELIHTMRGHRGAIERIAFDPQADELYSASQDGTVRRWGLHSGEELGWWTAHEKGVVDLAMTERGPVTIGRRGAVSLWTREGKLLETTEWAPRPTAIGPANGSASVVVGDWDGRVTVLDLATDKRTPLSDEAPLLLTAFAGREALAGIALPKPRQVAAADAVELMIEPLDADGGYGARLAALEASLSAAAQELSQMRVEAERLRLDEALAQQAAAESQTARRRDAVRAAIDAIDAAVAELEPTTAEGDASAKRSLQLLLLGRQWLADELATDETATAAR